MLKVFLVVTLLNKFPVAYYEYPSYDRCLEAQEEFYKIDRNMPHRIAYSNTRAECVVYPAELLGQKVVPLIVPLE